MGTAVQQGGHQALRRHRSSAWTDLAVRVADLMEKEAVLAANTKAFFTIPHLLRASVRGSMPTATDDVQAQHCQHSAGAWPKQNLATNLDDRLTSVSPMLVIPRRRGPSMMYQRFPVHSPAARLLPWCLVRDPSRS
jgi:hypothetical protein